MNRVRLEEIKNRAERAPAGPWRWRRASGGPAELVNDMSMPLVFGAALRFEPGLDVDGAQLESTMELIAHARDDIPELVAEVLRLRQALVRIRDWEADDAEDRVGTYNARDARAMHDVAEDALDNEEWYDPYGSRVPPGRGTASQWKP